MTGGLFVTRGDLTRLACQAVGIAPARADGTMTVAGVRGSSPRRSRWICPMGLSGQSAGDDVQEALTHVTGDRRHPPA